MLRKYLITILTILLLLVVATPSHAFWWMVYHKPAFKGKVIDAETKEPIEGAVVVAVYNKELPGLLGGGAISSVINVRETLTDKNGEFYISSYTTMIQPLSLESWVNFIIFKPGHGSYPNYHVSPPKVGIDPEEFFSRGKTGEEGEMEWKGIGKKFKVTFGIVELPKLNTREERVKALSSVDIPGPDIPSRYMKNLMRLYNEERRSLGFDPMTLP